MKTELSDSRNNKKIIPDENGKISVDDIVASVNFRIAKHRELIQKDEEVIAENVRFANIVTEAIERINERKAKIFELMEFLNYSLFYKK